MFYEIVSEKIFPAASQSFSICHASHLAMLPDGDVLAVWFAGSVEGAEDTAIWCAKRTGGEWSSPVILAKDGDEPHWNPVLLLKEDGTLLLFYKVGRLLKEWVTKVKTSPDYGRTWSESVELVPGDKGGRGPARNKVISLSDGSLLAPGSTEDGVWSAFVDRSTDQGESWVKSGEIRIRGLDYESLGGVESQIPVSEQSFRGRGVIQPTLWESESGKVHMLLRSTEGRIYRSDSDDFGVTWCDAYPTSLPNNNSGIDAVKLDSGLLVLVYNPVETNWGSRSPLVISASGDNGLTWSEGYILENTEGEYSYPAILAQGDRLFITYTWKRETVAFRQIGIS